MLQKYETFLRIFVSFSIVLEACSLDDSDELLKLVFEGDPSNATVCQNLTVKIHSIRECYHRNDEVKLKRLFYPKQVQIPGFFQINGTAVVQRKLPSEWNIDVSMSVQVPIVGWMQLPCLSKCSYKSVCGKQLLEKCKQIVGESAIDAHVNTEEPSKLCRCDLNKDTYTIPSIRIPVHMSRAKREHLGKYFSMRGVYFRAELVLSSSVTKKRFACFRSVFELIQ